SSKSTSVRAPVAKSCARFQSYCGPISYVSGSANLPIGALMESALMESAFARALSALTRALSLLESALSGMGTWLTGGVTTWAYAGKAPAYKIAPARRPRRAGLSLRPEHPFSVLSRE
ncbi:MAG: hypothetical protein QOD47_2126, partial [Gemmatimonadaceae bacterium]|nr:hypothetical protein [Gemmatimonadaceae bacterium]